jgi:hypothetical protein
MNRECEVGWEGVNREEKTEIRIKNDRVVYRAVHNTAQFL